MHFFKYSVFTLTLSHKVMLLCWIGNIGEKLHDSVFNLSFVIVSSGMHLQSNLMMMMLLCICVSIYPRSYSF